MKWLFRFETRKLSIGGQQINQLNGQIRMRENKTQIENPKSLTRCNRRRFKELQITVFVSRRFNQPCFVTIDESRRKPEKLVMLGNGCLRLRIDYSFSTPLEMLSNDLCFEYSLLRKFYRLRSRGRRASRKDKARCSPQGLLVVDKQSKRDGQTLTQNQLREAHDAYGSAYS